MPRTALPASSYLSAASPVFGAAGVRCSPVGSRLRGAAVGKTGAWAAFNETEKKRQQASQTPAQVSDLRRTLTGLTDTLTRLP